MGLQPEQLGEARAGAVGGTVGRRRLDDPCGLLDSAGIVVQKSGPQGSALGVGQEQRAGGPVHRQGLYVPGGKTFQYHAERLAAGFPPKRGVLLHGGAVGFRGGEG